MNATSMSSEFSPDAVARLDAILDRMTEGYARELLLDAYCRGFLPEHKHPDRWRPEPQAMAELKENCLLAFASLNKVCPQLPIDLLASDDGPYDVGRLLRLLPRGSKQLSDRLHRKLSVRGGKRNTAIDAARRLLLAALAA